MREGYHGKAKRSDADVAMVLSITMQRKLDKHVMVCCHNRHAIDAVAKTDQALSVSQALARHAKVPWNLASIYA